MISYVKHGGCNILARSSMVAVEVLAGHGYNHKAYAWCHGLDVIVSYWFDGNGKLAVIEVWMLEKILMYYGIICLKTCRIIWESETISPSNKTATSYIRHK